MSFATGLFLIDAPASALNNMGNIPGARTDNTVGVKVIRAKDGIYPYVSAQAFRYWLRTTLENSDLGWKAAPIYREEKVAYTDANPIEWWDDDLFGYMRAPSKTESATKKRSQDETRANETPTTDTITRVSPLRVSTLVSIAPATPTDDFGTMSRQDGDPVPFEHQFYRATLQGLLSLDLDACGTFSYRKKTGFRNLDEHRVEVAKAKGLQHLEYRKSYRLPLDERAKRVSTLFDGFAMLDGGAKQALHYTDVSPALVLFAVTKGGNNIFGHAIGATGRGQPKLNVDTLKEVISVYEDEILSDIYVGWAKGYLDDERARLEGELDLEANLVGRHVRLAHPRQIFLDFAKDMRNPENIKWLE